MANSARSKTRLPSKKSNKERTRVLLRNPKLKGVQGDRARKDWGFPLERGKRNVSPGGDKKLLKKCMQK